MHQIEALVDLLKGQLVGDHRIDLDFAVHVPVDDFGDIRPALRAAKGGAFPDPSGDQLERAGRDLRSSRCHTDDHRDTPAPVRAFERITHDLDIAGRIEGIVDAAKLVFFCLGDVDDRPQ